MSTQETPGYREGYRVIAIWRNKKTVEWYAKLFLNEPDEWLMDIGPEKSRREIVAAAEQLGYTRDLGFGAQE